jgi:hypothetical protein
MHPDGIGRRPDPPYPDEATIEHIVGIPDLLERNAAITRGYHALAEAVAAILGRDHANWLTFGQWASAEARRSISGEAVPAALRGLMGRGVAAAVADGNAAIFRDVAPPFIRFVRALAPIAGAAADPDVDPTAIRAAGEGLCSHPKLLASPDLTRAFTAYTDAILLHRGPDRTTPDAARRRAQRILVANASIGAHEQVIAEPFVRAAIPGRWIVAIAATSHMGIRIPEGLLELDRDIPPPAYLGGAPFPEALMTLVDPDAIALAARFGQDVDSAVNSDAPDWESYQERMGFIYTLLRAHQCYPALFDLPPGTPSG